MKNTTIIYRHEGETISEELAHHLISKGIAVTRTVMTEITLTPILTKTSDGKNYQATGWIEQ